MNELMIFKNENFGQVRTLTIQNKPYFVGKDVAEILGYNEPHKAISRHCKGGIKHPIGVTTGLKKDGTPTYQEVQMSIIPEGDVYRLIIKSKLPKAQEFEEWVMEEVLPQIRQTGGYIPIQEEDSEADIMAKALLIAQKTLENKDKLLKQKEEQIIELTPKAEFADTFLSTDCLFSYSQIAKSFAIKNFGKIKLIKYLKDNKIIIETDEAYQSHINSGHVVQKMGVYKKPVWNAEGKKVMQSFNYDKVLFTTKGLEYLYKKLRKEGYEPGRSLEEIHAIINNIK